MYRCARCGLPNLEHGLYGNFVSMLYDFYRAVKTYKESMNDNEQFIAGIEVEFLLQQLSELDSLSDYSGENRDLNE